MKKILTIFSGLMTTSLVTQATFAYTVNDKEKRFNIITASDFNKNEIEKLIATYFNNVEGIKLNKNLDLNKVREKTDIILVWLLIACIIDKKEEIKTILTTKPENPNISNLDYQTNIIFYKLFYPFMLKLSNEKMLKVLIFIVFFFDKQLGSFLEANILGDVFEMGILGNVFKVTLPELANNEDTKLTLVVKKNVSDNNILDTIMLSTAFNHVKTLVKEKFDETTAMHILNAEQDQIHKIIDGNDRTIMNEKMINVVKLFISDDCNFKNLKDIYDEIQFEEETLTIDFNNIMD